MVITLSVVGALFAIALISGVIEWWQYGRGPGQISAPKTVCVPVGFPIERFKQPEDRAYLLHGSWRFVCVGRMAPEKGFDVVLRAFASLRDTPDFHITFIGEGPDFRKLRMLAEELSLADRVTFCGHIHFDELIDHLADFDALVIGSMPIEGSNWRETQCCVMQEAMLMGNLVVASAFGGIPESLPPILHPYLYEPGAPEELTVRLKFLMELDVDGVRALASEATEFVRARYDVGVINQTIFSELEAPARPQVNAEIFAPTVPRTPPPETGFA